VTQRRTIGVVARGLIERAATPPMARRRPSSWPEQKTASRFPGEPGMDLVRNGTLRRGVLLAQSHARHPDVARFPLPREGIGLVTSNGRAVSNRFWERAPLPKRRNASKNVHPNPVCSSRVAEGATFSIVRDQRCSQPRRTAARTMTKDGTPFEATTAHPQGDVSPGENEASAFIGACLALIFVRRKWCLATHGYNLQRIMFSGALLDRLKQMFNINV